MSAQKLKSNRNNDHGHSNVAVDQVSTERFGWIAHLSSVDRHEKQGPDQHSEADGHEREERVTGTLNVGCRHGAPITRTSGDDAAQLIKSFGICSVPLMQSPSEPERAALTSAKIRKSERNNEHRGSDVAVHQILPVGFGWFAHGGLERVTPASAEEAVELTKDFGIALVPLMSERAA